MNTNFKHSAFASDWGTVRNVKDNDLRYVISILENYELALLGYDYEEGCAVPDAGEIEDADAIVSVMAMLKKELNRRERGKIARYVWKEAEAKGWKRESPAMRANVEAMIDRIANGYANGEAVAEEIANG